MGMKTFAMATGWRCENEQGMFSSGRTRLKSLLEFERRQGRDTVRIDFGFILWFLTAEFRNQIVIPKVLYESRHSRTNMVVLAVWLVLLLREYFRRPQDIPSNTMGRSAGPIPVEMMFRASIGNRQCWKGLLRHLVSLLTCLVVVHGAGSPLIQSRPKIDSQGGHDSCFGAWYYKTNSVVTRLVFEMGAFLMKGLQKLFQIGCLLVDSIPFVCVVVVVGNIVIMKIDQKKEMNFIIIGKGNGFCRISIKPQHRRGGMSK
jgi:hypothetical protein